MSTLTETAVKALLATATTTSLRPRHEGANISVGIGFKHVNYLVEAAVLEHFQSHGLPIGELFLEAGLGLELTRLDTRLNSVVVMDDVVTATVTPTTKEEAAEFTFTVTLEVERAGTRTKAVTSKVAAVFRAVESDQRFDRPAALDRFTVAGLGAAAAPGRPLPAALGDGTTTGRGSTGADPVLARLLEGKNAHGWKWRIPYFYCHYNERIQTSGYLRQMEEVVDLFLADRGISVRTLLAERSWIPAVTHSRIDVLDEALMEEELYTVYTMEEIFKDLLYRSRMDCYVVRDGLLVQTATGVITHGYAEMRDGDRAWGLVSFDDRVRRAFNNER